MSECMNLNSTRTKDTPLIRQKNNSLLTGFLLFSLCIPMLRASVMQRRRATYAYTQIDIYNIIDILSVVLTMFLCLANIKKISQEIKQTPVKAFTVYYFFCILSLLWAIRLEIFYTPYRAIEMIVTMCGCLLLCKLKCNAISCYKMIMNFCSVIWMPKIIQIFLTKRSFNLFFYHTNNYTIIGLVAFLMALAAYKEKLFPIKNIILPLISGVLCLCIGASSASFISAFIGIWLIYSMKNGKISISRLLIACVIGLLLWYFQSDKILQFIFPNKSIKLIITGTGRVDMWKYYINAWRNAPWLGYGFPVGEKEAQLFGWVQTSSSHNSFISVLINTGIFGMIFYLTFLRSTLKKVYGHRETDCGCNRGLFAVITAVILNSCSFPVIGSSWSYATTPALMCFAMAIVYNKAKGTK